MKPIKKNIILAISIILIIIIGLFITINRLGRRGLPDYKHDLVIKGLEKPVKVYYDSTGIPHIYAATEHDLYMATGFIMAQERMWQMDLLRRVTLGRLSEIFGDEYIKTDLLLRSLRYSEKSKKIIQHSSKETVEALQAFADGVNSYIKRQKGDFPVEFFLLGYKPEKWEPYHSLNLIGYMAWDLKSGWNELVLEKIAAKVDSTHLMEILPDLLHEKTCIFRPDNNNLLSTNSLINLKKVEDLGCDILSGSNNWAVSGKKSVTGKPLLANDMHLSFNLPGIWFQLHQVVEGKLNVTGLAIPGQPLIIVGHNDSIAWGMTNTYVDNLDYYEEKVNPADSNQYLFNDEWKNFKICNETVISKDGTKHELQYRLNHRGPVVSEYKGIGDKVITIRWVGDLESDELRSIYLLNRAHNWDDFRNAFSTFKSISQNVAYADCKGNIGLYCCAGIPVRKRDKVFAILPGWTDEYDWQGLIPFEELPNIYNPECGYVLSANNKTTDDKYSYHIGTWYALPYRYQRIKDMIESKEKLSVDDFRNMQNDFVSAYASKFLSVMLPFFDSENNLNTTEKEALQLLKQWDFNMSLDKVAPTILETWSNIITEDLFKDELGEETYRLFINENKLNTIALYNILNHANSVWADNILTTEKESLADIATRSFKRTIEKLIFDYGNDSKMWLWGKIHHITLQHPLAKVKILDLAFNLNRGPYPLGGSDHTVSPYRYLFDKPNAVVHGASHRNIYDPDNWNNSVSIIPTGNSGISTSEFYCNQTEDYINGKYHADFFTLETLEEKKLYVLNLLPR
jgi:penicillin G amidase